MARRQAATREQVEELLTIAEFARRAKVCTKTVRRRIAAGEITAFSFGPRCIRIPASELCEAFKVIPTAGGNR